MSGLSKTYMDYMKEAALKEPALYDHCFTESGKLRDPQGYYLRGFKNTEPKPLEEVVKKVHFPKSEIYLEEKRKQRRAYQKNWMRQYRLKLKLKI